jgi:ubiquinone/menaquinone biosynthesis C-methylase UbiE
MKFNPKNLEKLRNPKRLELENPDLIWEKMALVKPECLVDVGCGIGFSAIPMAKKMPGGKVYACDISLEMLSALGEEIKNSGVDNIRPILMEEVKIPVEGGCADGVLMQNLHHELKSPVESLKECGRILRPGGKIAVIDWKKVTAESGPPLEIRVSPKKIGSDLREAGFIQIEALEVLPCHSFLVATKP